ncbi:MAG: hypothetical protein KF751_02950 [Nitrospira sp.]|nr:hypothetical protein [Nitrospira sp.]MBX3348955.1 hypothetical protein [Nitrospira sp.]
MRGNILIQPEPFEFDLESDVLETGFNEFENFEALESEAVVGGIPEKDYLRWVQFSLNMYFKKMGLRALLVEDGKDSANFRNAVELFNTRAWGRSENKHIDTKFQDAIIKVNEANSGYLKWLRTQLDKLGFAPFTVVYPANEKPTKAIAEFQRIYSGKYGFSLEQDGFVGAKTHLALLYAIKRANPEPTIKPTATWSISEADANRIKEYYGHEVLNWAKIQPEEVEVKEFGPPPSLRGNYKTIFAWKSANPRMNCVFDSKQRLQLLVMLRDDKEYWDVRTNGNSIMSAMMQTAAQTAIRDYRHFIIERRMCPRDVYNKLVQISKDVIYQMFLGMFQLLSPAGVPNRYPQHTAAFAELLKKLKEWIVGP